MNLEPGWLERQLKAASATVASWPIEKQVRMRRETDAMFEQSRIEAEDRYARRFDPRHGNY